MGVVLRPRPRFLAGAWYVAGRAFPIRLVWCHLRQVILEQEPTHIERK
jgi:hypothetical protein